MWINTSLNTLFFSPAAMRKGPGSDLTKKELVVLTALNITKDNKRGQSVGSLHRLCEKYGHCFEYRNFKKLMNGLEQKGYIKVNGLHYSITTLAMATLSVIDRKLTKLLEQAKDGVM